MWLSTTVEEDEREVDKRGHRNRRWSKRERSKKQARKEQARRKETKSGSRANAAALAGRPCGRRPTVAVGRAMGSQRYVTLDKREQQK